MNAPCYDLHTHIVPGVDDGPVTPAEALRILGKLRSSMPDGSVIAATPHFSTSMPELAVISRADRACRFAEKASDPKLRVLCAGELRLGFTRSRAHEVVAYPGTRRVLVEFSPGMIWFGVLRLSMRIMKRGYRPLLAHVERYSWATRARIRFLAGLGSGISVSLRSLAVHRYRKRAEWVMGEGLCHVLTSDCHTENDMVLGEEARMVVEKLCPGAWPALTVENPARILADEPLPPFEDRRLG